MSLRSFIGSRKNSMTGFILFLVVGAVLFLMKGAKAGTISQVPGVPSDFRYQAALDFSDSQYKNLENWLAVSKMETSKWTSGLYRNANNPWGMTFPKHRPTRAAGIYSGSDQLDFARYDDFDDATADLILWMDYEKFPKGQLTLQEHIKEMGDRGYFGTEAPTLYLSKVLAWLNR